MRLSVVDGRVVSEDGTVHDLSAAIEGIPWVTAMQYPPSHQYVIVERCPVDAWSILDTAIARHPASYLAYFRGYQRPNRYWDFDGRPTGEHQAAARTASRTCSIDAGSATPSRPAR